MRFGYAATISIGRTCRAGQIFSVAEGELHDEWFEASGAHVLVGRKHSQAAA
jgi:hypothetical protein